MSVNYYAKIVKSANDQQGVGLIEVLIALLLLAVAALGYSALQAQSIKSTDEALTRTHAINLMHNTAQKIRVNGIDATYIKEITDKKTGKTTQTTDQILELYAEKINLNTMPADVKCDNGCTPSQQVTKDVRELWKASGGSEGTNDDRDIRLGMDKCPGRAGNPSNNYCLFAAWKDTEPKKGNASPKCMTEEGAYLFNANCIMMEVY